MAAPQYRTTAPPPPGQADAPVSPVPGTAGEVLRVFLKLGFTSFGGPVAHIGYFRNELVVRRKWVDDGVYADLVALCQFLPGPASSKVGFALGLLRGGPLGGLAAWSAFTLPSAVLLVLFALGARTLQGPAATGMLHGLKVVAVAVVAQAVWGMARTLAPDRTRAAIALAAVMISVSAAGVFGQVAAIAAGGAAGLWLCRGATPHPPRRIHIPVSRAAGMAAFALFFALLSGLPWLASASGSHVVALVDSFYRAGALVFGGGHVVLPLLQEAVVRPGWIGEDGFLAGYGAAQAVPGPLFTVAAYLGAAMRPEPHGIAGAAICLVSIFVPGLLLTTGALPFWDIFRTRPAAQAAMRGANAAVVGILAAALYSPVWTSTIQTPRDFAAAAAGFVLLTVWHAPPWAVVILLGAAGAAAQLV